MLHDTTEINPISKSIREFNRLSGFRAHVSLLVHSTGQDVFGPVGLKLMTRPARQQGRWLEFVEEAEKCAPENVNLLHVMDSEADSSDIWHALQQNKRRFVIRARYSRQAKTKSGKPSLLFDEIEKAPVLGGRNIWVSKRKGSVYPARRASHVSRDQKVIHLKVSAQRIRVNLTKLIGKCHHDSGQTAEINVVRAFEKLNASTGRDKVDWILLTSEPIGSLEEVFNVIDIYRHRWLVEEYFKALKTGCQLEKRLLADKKSWWSLTSLMMPIATTLLNLRLRLDLRMSQASFLISAVQMKILKIKAKEHGYKFKTYSDAQAVIAKLGGHIKWNGPPGWITLLRGYLELRLLEQGWLLAQKERCDK